MRIEQGRLRAILSTVSKALSVRVQLPILSHIAFDDGQIYATDLEKYIIFDVPEVDFSACVPGRLISDLAGTLQGMVELEMRGDKLIVSAGKQSSEIKVIQVGEMPIIPCAATPADWHTTPAVEFLTAIDKVAFAAATDEARPVLTGVLVNSLLGISAADGFRLATTGYVDKGHIIPAKTLAMLPALFGNATVIRYAFGVSQAYFSAGGVTVITQLVEGNFPNLDQIIPKAFKSTMTFNSVDALRALKTVMVLSDDSHLVHFEHYEDVERGFANSIMLKTESASGDAMGTFEIAGCEHFEPFALNGQLFKDALSAMDKVTMCINAPSQPVVLTESEYTHVIMPMAIRKAK